MVIKFPIINWVTQGADFDYRPAIGPDGTTVVFERTINGQVLLYILEDLQGSNSRPLLPLQNNDDQTRPDWNWDTDTITLNIQSTNSNISTVNPDGSNLTAVNGTTSYFYPQSAFQLPNGADGYVVVNNTTKSPKNTLIDGFGQVIIPNMNGTDANSTPLFGGMPTVFPGQSTRIAFAGQPALPTWNKTKGYNQNRNYIFLNTENNDVFTSSPMESSASILAFDPNFQGRAPAISPDGNFIAFESNRNQGFAIYLFNLSIPNSTAIQLTDTSTKLNSQHPKFSPDGTRLIFSATNPNSNQSNLAWIDISEYLK